ncbi:MAG: hypothetical protein Q7S45_00695, partial [Candidatus Curtissbacteria bacterium]|nr:hypothetical protein [Candidatus Curtissbacteria bacterium]
KNMNKNILYISILIAGILVAGVTAGSVAAQTGSQVTPEISYPVAELGNCADKAACKVYCDESANIDACLNFAEKNNLMSRDEIKVAKNFKSTGMTGPGGCKGKNECSSYCNGPDHMDECITFAEKNGMMSGSQLEEAKKVQMAVAKGIKPPACGGKEACDSYCSSSEHMEECVSFAESAGIISKEEADKIKSGGPGGKGGDKQGPGGGKQGPEGQGGNGGGKSNGGPKGQGGQGQGNGGQRRQQGQGGQGGQGNGGPGLGGQQQGQGPNGQQNQQDPGGPGGQDQNQGDPESGGQIPGAN